MSLFTEKRVSPLPPDADWLTRHHYTTIKAARDAEHAKEQEAAWAAHMARQGGGS